MDTEKKGNTQERVPTNFVTPANVWPLINAIPNAKTQWLAMKAMLTYGYTGVRHDTGDPIANGILEVAIPQIDAMNRRDRRGAPRGNQNARKYYKTASERNKAEKTNTANCFASNSMNSNELQGVEKTNNKTNTANCVFDAEKGDEKTNNKTNTANCFASNSMNSNELQGVEKTKKTNIDIDIDRLNTSPLPELVLSQEKEKLKEKETAEPALAPLNGGAVSSYSFSDKQNSSDGKPAPAPLNGRASLPTSVNEKNWNEGETTPQTSSDISRSLQSPPPPTPAPARRSPKPEGSKLTDEEWEQLNANVRADLERGKAMADAERDAIAKGEPLPPAARGIKPVIDDSDTARQEREAKRIHDIQHLIEMAETEEEKEKLRAWL